MRYCRQLLIRFVAFIPIVAYSEIEDENDLIVRMDTVCRNSSQLLDPNLTNDIEEFRSRNLDAKSRGAADLALAVILMHRFDRTSDSNAFARHQMLTSNLFHSTSLPLNSWLRHAGAFEYACGLNADGQFDKGFFVTTNLLSMIAQYPTDLEEPNFWSAMMQLEECPATTVEMAFKANAAFELARQKRWAEMGVYTNSLPSGMIRFIKNDMDK